MPNSNPIPTAADIAAEHTQALDTLDFNKVIAALPDVIDSAMRKTLPAQYTAELAAQIAQAMTAELTQAATRPLTAAERGTDWMLRWGCPPWCTEAHGTPNAMDSHSTRPVETTTRAADPACSGYSEGTDNLPWLTAQTVVASDKAQAYGRQTRVWLGYGVHLADVTPAKAREALAALRDFTDGLEKVVEFAEQVAADDFAGDEEVARLDMEAQERRGVRHLPEGGAA